MHAIRGSWVGQTFALARCHNSGEKKARSRPSKEERKELVVSFIKKYQLSNKGDFPSLTVTKREVGGSFYTIREIVREIIQENRVLGPAKSKIDEQDADNFFDHHPLGSVAMEPDIPTGSSNGPHIVDTSILPNTPQNTVESQFSGISEKCQELDNQKLDDGIIVNGNFYQSERTQGFGGKLENEPPIVRGDDILEKAVVIPKAKTSPLAADIIIETFPIKPVTNTIALDGDSGEPRVIAGTLEENESVNMNVETVNSVDILNTEDVQEKSSKFVDEKTNLNAEDEEADSSPEILNHSAREISTVLRVDDDRTDLEKKDILPAEIHGVSHDCRYITPLGTVLLPPRRIAAIALALFDSICQPKKQHTSVPNGTENLNPTLSGGFQVQSISEEVIATEKKSGIQNSSSSKKSSDPTLDRISLESWEANTDRSGGPQTNNLLEFVKACITAFVKFWSE
uniref:AT3G52170-like helix-turn-helix domain-containing protein n=1 Tax=Daucus carota subsp. sativus TaxID=79200 RepID=A0A164ZEM3_DAUCS